MSTMTPSEIEPALDLAAVTAMELISTQKKLKIATEALEGIIDADDGRERIARRALAHIKEMRE